MPREGGKRVLVYASGKVLWTYGNMQCSTEKIERKQAATATAEAKAAAAACLQLYLLMYSYFLTF